MTRLGHFTVHEADPEVRTYSLDTEACVQAVGLGKRGRIACDLETNGLAEESYEVKLIMVSDDRHAAVLDAYNPKHRQAVSDAFDATDEINFHNAPFDVPPLVHCGAMTLDHIDKVTDTLIWANMALSDQLGGKRLADLEKSVLGASDLSAEKDRFEQWCKVNKYTKSEGFKAARYSDRGYSMYGGWDTLITYRLRDPMLKMVIDLYTNHPFGRFGADRELAEELAWREQIINRVMLRRSARGLAVDLDLLQREQDRIAAAQSDLAEDLRAFGVTSPTNPGQLVAALEKEGALPEDYPRTEKTKQPSTAGKYLGTLTHPAARMYTEYFNHNKLFNYLENARVIAERTDGRLHPVVGVMRAVTGRQAYSNPALHQFTRPAREAVEGDEDLSSLDWAAIEPVLGANLSGDVEALEVYEQSGDLYQAAAAAGGTGRKQAKVTLLAGMYGQGLAKLAVSLGLEDIESEDGNVLSAEDQATEVRGKVNSAMPRTGNLIGWAAEWARETGLTFTLSGRIIPVHHSAPYKGTNYTVQGSSYDLLAETLVEMHRRGIADHLHVTMHDEVIVSTSVAEEVREIMSTPPERLIELAGRVPVLRTDRADIGERWRTPDPCHCGSEKSLSWQGERSWRCVDHVTA